MTIEFGIPSVDSLINPPGSNSQGDQRAVKKESLCIIGPDGAGKSVLAMHAASWYWMKTSNTKNPSVRLPVIIYASTDFRYSQFSQTWKAFGLNYPRNRAISLDGLVDFNFTKYETKSDRHLIKIMEKLRECREEFLTPGKPGFKVTETPRDRFNGRLNALEKPIPLKPIVPFPEPPDWLKEVQEKERAEYEKSREVIQNVVIQNSLPQYPLSDDRFDHDWSSVSKLLEKPEGKMMPPVWFLDLADFSGGDDWLLINRLCGMLSTLKTKDNIPHLFILDAVEGVEAMTGDFDPFGIRHSRRSRVAQFMRTAASANANTLLIVEEAETTTKLPEEFIVDTVLRLRTVRDGDYSHRTIEVEKARATSHIRGQHDFIMSSGEGSVTGEDKERRCHVDDPRILTAYGVDEKFERTCLDTTLSYVFSAHTLHAYSHSLKRSKLTEPDLHVRPIFPLFGLKHLRRMLGQNDDPLLPDGDKESGSVTVLLGDSGTFKSKLGRNFLAQNFIHPDTANSGSSVLISTYGADLSNLRQQVILHARDSIQSNDWADALTEDDAETACKNATRNGRILTRRIPFHYLTSSMFLRIVRAYIRKCQRQLDVESVKEAWIELNKPHLSEEDQKEQWDKIRKDSWRIRLVIDDWNLLLSSHQAMKRDPLLLPSLYYLLRRSGVTALIVSTQTERPLLPQNTPLSNSSNDLRTLDTHQVIVWPVQFFGERRVAMTAAPGSSVIARSIAYEVLPKSQESDSGEKKGNSPELLDIDRHFALYSGLQENRPKRVPLRLRLFLDRRYENGDRSHSYFDEITNVFTELYPDQDGRSTVTYKNIDSYGDFASFADWMDDSTLDYSHIIQVDEFWLQNRKLRNLLNLEDYLHSTTATILNGEPEAVPSVDNDPLRRFQPHPPDKNGGTPDPPAKQNIDGSYTFRRIDFFPQDSLIRDEALLKPSDKKLEETKKERNAEANDKLNRFKNKKITHDWEYDRVPFQKDFGFLLVRRDLWERALKRNDNPDLQQDVKDVWKDLCICSDLRKFFPSKVNRRPRGNFRNIPWEKFFRACEYVRGSELVPSFDIDFSIGETLNATVLEIWFSEMMKTKTDFDMLRDVSVRNGVRIESLHGLAKNQSLTLFATLSRLMKACSHLLGDQIRTHRPADPNAVAARHWYSSATEAIRKNSNLIPMRLPGHYSTRGDWFIGAAAGSRSQLAAYRAIDILTSRRMNMLCLQDGIGLPARNIARSENIKQIYTSISLTHPTLGQVKKFMLGEIEAMQGHSLITLPRNLKGEKQIRAAKDKAFFPLWRSQIENYDRHSLYFFRWLKNIFMESNRPFVETHPNTFKSVYKTYRKESDNTIKAIDPEFKAAYHQFKALSQTLTSMLRE